MPYMEKLVLKSPNCADLSLDAETLEIKHFPDSESYVRIPVECAGKEVAIVHRCYPDPDSSLIQLFLAIRQLKEMGSTEITAIVPYLPYARQDKRFLSGEAMSSEIICRMIKEAGCKRLITFDCHFLKKQGEFVYGGLPITNISLGGEVVAHLKEGLANPLIISPDAGARYLTEGEKNKGVMKKVRGNYGKGESAYREVAKLEAKFDVKGRDVIIVDDIIAGGSTMIKALALCKDNGAKSVRCGAVHGLFLGGALEKILSGGATQVACTSSIPAKASKIDISFALKNLI
jgi:ribose-phosphate pyrophosphokinase